METSRESDSMGLGLDRECTVKYDTQIFESRISPQVVDDQRDTVAFGWCRFAVNKKNVCFVTV